MPLPVNCKWSGRTLNYYDDSGNLIATYDFTNRQLDLSPSAAVNRANVSFTSRFKWDFSVTPTVAATPLNPLYGQNLPAKAVVISAQMYVKTAITGGTNASIQLVGANDIISAAATSGAPWSSSTTNVVGVPVPQTAATWVTVASASQPQMLSTATALTAGVVILFVEWVMIE